MATVAEPRAETAELVYLRQVGKKDRSEFLALMQQSRPLHDPWIAPPLTEVSFHNYLARTQRDDHQGWLYRLCCTEGPVFAAKDIVWEPAGCD